MNRSISRFALAIASGWMITLTPASAQTFTVPTLKPQLKFQLKGEYNFPKVQVSADGKRVAILHSGVAIQVWELGSEPKLLSEFKMKFPEFFTLSPSGNLLYSASEHKVYDVTTKKVVVDNLFEVCSHAFFRDENTLVLTQNSYDSQKHTKGTITTWEIAKGKRVDKFEVPDRRFSDALLAKDGKEIWLFMSNKKFEVECYDLDTGKLARTIQPEPSDPNKPYQGSGSYLSVTRDGTTLSARLDKFRVFDSMTGKMIATIPPDWLSGSNIGIFPVGTLCLLVAYSDKPNGYGLKDRDCLLYDWKEKKGLAILPRHTPGKDKYSWIVRAVSADGKTVVSVSEEGEVLVYDLSSFVKK